MKCKSCGNEFEKTGARQKYCHGCRNEMGLKMSKAWKDKNKAPDNVRCEICGKMFLKKNGNLTCSLECRKERERIKQLEKNIELKARRAAQKGVYAKKPKPHGLNEKLVLARDGGMTYAEMQRRESLDRAGKVDVTLGGMI